MKIAYPIIIVLLLMHTGCAELLPKSAQITPSTWQSFNQAKQAFDQIMPEQTTLEDLKLLGFDPCEAPNIKVVTYLDITAKFALNPSIKLRDLHPGIRSCLQAKEACYGLEVTPTVVNTERYGNAMLDLLNFRRKTMVSGWKFAALIVLKNNLVVYKLWSGQPNVLELEDKRNPLGPFQDVGKYINPNIKL